MTDEPKLHEFWQCPSCYARYWTLYPRLKATCLRQEDDGKTAGCMTRAVPISFETYMKPDGKPPTARAWISTDDPEIAPSF